MTTQSLPKTTVEIRGDEVRKRRAALGKPSQAFADELGITRDYLYKLELGHRRRVSAALFARICEVLAVADRNELQAVA